MRIFTCCRSRVNWALPWHPQMAPAPLEGQAGAGSLAQAAGQRCELTWYWHCGQMLPWFRWRDKAPQGCFSVGKLAGFWRAGVGWGVV